MRRLLILTSRDFLGFSNSRVHHLAHYFARIFAETAVIFRTHSWPQGGIPKAVKNFFTFELQEKHRGSLRLLMVNPLGARRYGVATRLLRLRNPFEERPKGGKRLLQEIFATLGAISDLLIIPSLLRAAKTLGKQEVLIAQGPFEMYVGAILKEKGLVDLFVCDDADYEPGFAPTRLRQKILRWAERKGMQKADLVVSVGELLAARRRREYGLSNVHVIPNGVDWQHFYKAALKKRNNLVLLYMGFLGGWSGLDLLLETLALFKEQTGGLLSLLLAGHQDEFFFKDWQRRAREKEISFFYLGRLPYRELIKPLSRATIGWAMFPPVLLRKYAFPLKVVEYFAGGLAVLATENTESGNTVTRWKAGFALPYDPQKVAEALTTLTRSPFLLEKLRANAISAAPFYDWKNLLRKYEELLKKYI